MDSAKLLIPYRLRLLRYAVLTSGLVLLTGFVAFLVLAGGRGLAVGLLVTATALTTVLLTAVLVRGLMQQLATHGRAHAESERHAGMLEVVARAARGMSTLDSDRVLSAVVDAATALGFESANFCVFDDSGQTYRVAHPRGLPDAYVRGVHPSSSGMPGLVRERKATVVVSDYMSHPHSLPMLRKESMRAVIATPVWVQGRLAAVLVGGSRQPLELGPQDVEAFELLGAQAGSALENARRFEDQRRALERLAELDRLKRDFISTVSHELRTPLAVIEGMGLTLQERWERLGENQRRDLLKRLNDNAGQLDAIITTLLDFSRLEAGQLEVRARALDLKGLLRSVAARLSSLFADHHLAVEVDDGLIVRADPMLLERIVENLLSNAAKHTPKGTRVMLSARADETGAVVAVTDLGPGIPAEELRHLGERFFRGGHTEKRHTRGTGLGLALVQEILQLHGTALEIDSDLGRGSRFAFRLPMMDRRRTPRGLVSRQPV